MKFLVILLALAVTLSGVPSYAAGFQNECFQHTVYVTGTATGGSGNSYGSPKPASDVDLWDIPANTKINNIYVVIDVLFTGTSDFDVGDDDDPDGFIDGSLSVTLGTVGMYGQNAKLAGAYLRVQTAGATDAADIYVVPNSKFYSGSGKEVKLDVTGTWTAGKARVIIEGCKMKPTGL